MMSMALLNPVYAAGSCPTSSTGNATAQFTLTLDAATGSAPISTSNYFAITSTANYATCTTQATGTTTVIYLDPTNATFTNTVTVSARSSASGSTEEWCFMGTPGTCAKETYSLPEGHGPYSEIYTYYNQFLITFGYSDQDSSVITSGAPIGSYYQFGSSSGRIRGGSSYGTTSPASGWVDAGTGTVSYTTYTNGDERWAFPAGTISYDVGSSTTISESGYYDQYVKTLSYSVSGGGSPAAPTFSTTKFGAPVFQSLTTAPTVYWFDAGSSWNVTTTLAGSNSAERWELNTESQPANGTVSAASPATAAYTYYHQYMVAFSLTVFGGGTGYSPPSVNFSQFGEVVSGTQGWADAGTSYAYTNPLPGSSTTERWYTANSTGTVSGATTFNPTFYHQYPLLVGYAIIPSGSGYVAPYLNYTTLEVLSMQPLSTSPTTIWADSDTHWSVPAILIGSSSSERWITDQVVSGSAGAPVNETFDYYHQYYVTFSYSIVGGGAPQPPTVFVTDYGMGNRALLANGSASLWVDDGSTWTYPNLLPGSNGAERWVSNSTTSGTTEQAATLSLAYLHQYLLRTQSDTSQGGTILNSTGWDNSGERIPLNATAASGWKFEYWMGAGSGSYNGTSLFLSIPLSGPANETAVFWPGVTITSFGGGTVTYTASQVMGNVSGTQVVFVPFDGKVTLKAVPATFDYIFIGWAQAAQGTSPIISFVAGSPTSVTANFTLDYSDIGVVAVVIPVIVIMAVFILVVRRWPHRS